MGERNQMRKEAGTHELNGDVGAQSAIDGGQNILARWKVTPVSLVTKPQPNAFILTSNPNIKGLLILEANLKNIQQALTTKNVWGITSLEFASSRDGMHHPHSSFNQVLAKLARHQNKAVVFLLSSLVGIDREVRASVLARLSQNMALCRKYGVSWHLWSGAHNPFEWVSPASRMAFARVLGASSEQAKKAVAQVTFI